MCKKINFIIGVQRREEWPEQRHSWGEAQHEDHPFQGKQSCGAHAVGGDELRWAVPLGPGGRGSLDKRNILKRGVNGQASPQRQLIWLQ